MVRRGSDPRYPPRPRPPGGVLRRASLRSVEWHSLCTCCLPLAAIDPSSTSGCINWHRPRASGATVPTTRTPSFSYHGVFVRGRPWCRWGVNGRVQWRCRWGWGCTQASVHTHQCHGHAPAVSVLACVPGCQWHANGRRWLRVPCNVLPQGDGKAAGTRSRRCLHPWCQRGQWGRLKSAWQWRSRAWLLSAIRCCRWRWCY